MQPSQDEEEILIALADGNEDAFRVLYEKYAPRLKSFCLRFKMDQLSSDDIIQETFRKVWENKNSIHTWRNFNTYLIAIAKHLIYNQLRHDVYVKKYSSEIKSTVVPQYETGGSLDLKMIVDKSILALPEKCRNIYKLSRIDGFSNSEIANKLNISVSTVENQLNKALKRIKADLRKAGYYLPLILIFLLL